MDIGRLSDGKVLRGTDIDSAATRERSRQRRLLRTSALLGCVLVWYWWRRLSGNPVKLGLPVFFRDNPEMLLSVGLLFLLGGVILLPFLGAGRSPHVVLRPEDTGIKLDDVVGAEQTRREAIDTLNLFLAHRTFTEQLGGTPRRGVLFEGAPGTGKTYLAKAMAGEAGVPFLFVSASAFQSMYYGQTNRKIRTFFKELRKLARSEGGAIGFIEEFDAIGGARSGMGGSSMREGITGVVNELLVQMQSFDVPDGPARMTNAVVDFVNRFLPSHRQWERPQSPTPNVLVIAATNRASDLDPALIRPGRFDRIIHFDLPPRSDRHDIAEYYLGIKSHAAEVDPDFVADITSGYSPVMIERLLDEALVCALRSSRREMVRADVLDAKLITELGLAQKVGYEPLERRRIAVHEAGHALLAELLGRRVEVASILRRSASLGLVAHGELGERHLRTPTEARALIQIAFGGLAAEELEFGEASSGIASDLQAATTIAAQLVGTLGGAGSRFSLEAAGMPTATNIVAKVASDQRSRDAAESILSECEHVAMDLVGQHRDALYAIADALLEQDELSGDEVRVLVARHREPSLGSASAG
ncbi:MAG: AAA family ATPase [Ilumatobacteraceae bacterium]